MFPAFPEFLVETRGKFNLSLQVLLLELLLYAELLRLLFPLGCLQLAGRFGLRLLVS